jgi:hypothetical protein
MENNEIKREILRLKSEFWDLERDCKNDASIADYAWSKLQNLQRKIDALERRL